MKHSKHCQDYTDASNAAIAAWRAAHPHACPHCAGWGSISGPGCSVPYGSTWVSLPDEADPCPHCVDESRCPHCAAEITFSDDGYGACQACGWKDGESDGEPMPYECSCWDLPENDPWGGAA